MKLTRNTCRLIKRIGTAVGVLILIVAIVQIAAYVTRPQIQYSLQEADCSNEAVTARNKVLGANLKSCVLIISAKNVQNKSVRVDYDGVDGGFISGGEPLIRIYSGKDKFCYALLGGQSTTFAPNATNKLTLRCSGVQKPPKDYDKLSDTNPTSVVVAGYSKTIIKFVPVR